MLAKFFSRKFILSLAAVICGILGMTTLSDNIVCQVGNILMVIIPSVVYVITEGKIDKDSLSLDMEKLFHVINSNK